MSVCLGEQGRVARAWEVGGPCCSSVSPIASWVGWAHPALADCRWLCLGISERGAERWFSSFSDPVLVLKPEARLMGGNEGGGIQKLPEWIGGIELDFRRKCQTWRRAFLVLALPSKPASQALSGGSVW